MKSTMQLKDATFFDVKREALEQAKEAHYSATGGRLTQDMIHLRTGIPLSNVNRYFNDPDYNPGVENLPHICRAMNNYLMLDWIAAQCGGLFIRRGAEATRREAITTSVDKIQRGASDLLSGVLEALRDGNITREEVRAIAVHFRSVATVAEEGLAAMEQTEK